MPDDSQPTPGPPNRDQVDLIDAVVNDTPEQSPTDPTTSTDNTNDQSTEASGETNKGKKKKPQPTTFAGKLWHNWVKPIGSVVLVVVILRSSIIDWNDVPSGSMEPTILVGDRILVNKLAFALQPPFAGPKIGVPFTSWQWDNPLDGLPAWQWGEPKRGDIVTFWNPDSGVRMVKRIVAQSGDTVEMRGGQLIINGTTASYIDNTTTPRRVGNSAAPPNNPNMVKYEDLEESILGETRNIQHIKTRWIASWGRLRFSGGRAFPTYDGMADTSLVGGPSGIRHNTEDGVSYRFKRQSSPERVEDLMAQDPNAVHMQILDGAPYLNGEAVSFMAFAAALLEPLTQDGPIELHDGRKLELPGEDFLIDGDPVPFDTALNALRDSIEHNDDSPEAIRAKAAYQEMGNILRSLMYSSFGPVTLGDDEYYMVGDNRNNSHDSRYFGSIQRSEITGEAVFIPFSFNGRIRDLSPRWGRTFHGLE